MEKLTDEKIIEVATKALKIRRLAKIAGMDEVAVKLNCEPMACEIEAATGVFKAFELAREGKTAWQIAGELSQ